MRRSNGSMLCLAAIAVAACDGKPTPLSPASSVFLEPAVRAGSATAATASLPPPERLWFSFEGREGGDVRGIEIGAPRHLSITWSPVPGATGYLFEIGSAEGAANLGAIRKNASERSHLLALEPQRPLWARVKSTNQDGVSAPSQEIMITWQDGQPKLDISHLRGRVQADLVPDAFVLQSEISEYRPSVSS